MMEINVGTPIVKLHKEFHPLVFLRAQLFKEITMLSLFKRDHFILGYAANGVLYIKSGKSISFDDLKRLGYDCSKAIDRKNNLFEQIDRIKVTHFMPLRKNLWRAPLFTVVSDAPLDAEEVNHLYRFCQLMGGINTTVSYVSSIQAFLDKPSLKLVRKNYYSC